MTHYPAEIEIAPMPGFSAATVQVPGSKSITNRAMVLAALSCAQHDVQLTGALLSEDTEIMVDCLRRLGFTVEANWPTLVVKQNTSSRIVPAATAELFVGNSGTTVRFVTAMLALGQGTYRLDGVARMRERPIQDLLDALNRIGAQATSDDGTGCPPVTIQASGWAGGMVQVRADLSSQFLSGLMLAAPFAEVPTSIRIDGPAVSEPYIDMTFRMLEDWGVTIRRVPGGFDIDPMAPSTRRRSTYEIEPDASAASYFLAIPAILGGRITVAGLGSNSLQGDVRFADALAKMGCRVETCDAGITVHGRPLHGIDIDMNDISDTVMTLGVVACFADGPTHIRNVAHIRHKETDRIAALATELRRVGSEVVEREDGLSIYPRPIRPAAAETYNDHRMAMSLALIGLRAPGMKIKNPGCVAKTYPGFWQDLQQLNRSA